MNIVILSTKHLLLVYSLFHCQQYILLTLMFIYIWSPDSFKLHVGFGADPRVALEAPRGTVPFGRGLVRTMLQYTFLCFHQAL